MKTSNWKDIAELFGVASIVASLIFVGLQLKQSQKIAIADVYQQQAALLIEVQISAYTSEQRLEAIVKRDSGKPLTEADKRILYSIKLPWLTYYENVGSRSEPKMSAERAPLFEDGTPVRLNHCMMQMVVDDWDDDGDPDLVIGEEDGMVSWLERVGIQADYVGIRTAAGDGHVRVMLADTDDEETVQIQ